MSVITPAAPATTESALATAAMTERDVPDSLPCAALRRRRLRCAGISLSILVPRSRASIELVSHSRSKHPRPGAVGIGPGVVGIDPPVFIGQVRSEQLYVAFTPAYAQSRIEQSDGIGNLRNVAGGEAGPIGVVDLVTIGVIHANVARKPVGPMQGVIATYGSGEFRYVIYGVASDVGGVGGVDRDHLAADPGSGRVQGQLPGRTPGEAALEALDVHSADIAGEGLEASGRGDEQQASPQHIGVVAVVGGGLETERPAGDQAFGAELVADERFRTVSRQIAVIETAAAETFCDAPVHIHGVAHLI